MTKEETQLQCRNDLAKMLIGSLFCIDQESKLKQFVFYKHKTSDFGTNYSNKLLALESDLYLQLNGVSKSLEEKKEFYSELMHGVESFNNIMDCLLRIKNDNQRQYFNDELETLVKKYNLIEE